MLTLAKSWYIILIVIVSSFFCYWSIQEGHKWGGDFSLYLQQAKYIAEDLPMDDLYQSNKFTIDHSNIDVGPYLYPNGFPLLLSPLYAKFGIHFTFMKGFCCLFFLLTLPLIYNLFKSHFENQFHPILLVCLIAFNYNYIVFSDNILSDFPYFFFCFLGLNLMHAQNTFKNQLVLGTVLFYAYFMRDVGIFLLPTYLTYQLLNGKKYKHGGVFNAILPYVIFGLLFLALKFYFPNGASNHYDILFSNLSLNGVVENLMYYLYYISKQLSFHSGSLLLGGLMFIVFMYGVISNFQKHKTFVIFLTLNLFMLILWPCLQGFRFMISIFPFLIFFTFKGYIHLADRLPNYKKRFEYLLMMSVLVSSVFSLKKAIAYSEESSNQAYNVEMVGIYEYISNEMDSTTIIGFHKPRVLSLFSNRKAVQTDLDHFNHSIAQYLLVSKKKLEEGALPFEIEKAFDSFVILKKRSEYIHLD